MVHEGRIGAPSSTTFPSGAPHHPSPYHHGSGGPRRRPSPPGSPTTSGGNHRNCCFKPTPMMYREPLFCCCYNCPAPTSLFASLGICCLVIGYTLMGAFTFMTLEGGFTAGGGTDTSSAVAASKSTTARIESILGADIRSRTVDKLWSITEDLNILYKENWTRLAAQEVMEFQDSLVRALRMSHSHSGYLTRQGGGTMFYHQSHRWTFSSSFLYSLTLITTIGYGSVSPHTPLGKLTTILYAVIGIPLMLVYLSTMGEVLARSFRHLYAKMCGVSMNNNMNSSGGQSGGCNRKSPGVGGHPSNNPQSNHISPIDSKLSHYYKDNGTGVILNCGTDMLQTSNTGDSRSTPYKSRGGGSASGGIGSGGSGQIQAGTPYCGQVVSIPVSLCLLIIILYIIGGAILFNRLENWSLLEGSYFCFTSLGTIGFGDLVPGEHSTITDEISHCVCSIYILIGMALIAMCFNLVQDDIALVIRSMGRLCGGGGGGGNNNYMNNSGKHNNMLGHHRNDYNTSQHFSHHYHHHAMDGCEEISMSVVS